MIKLTKKDYGSFIIFAISTIGTFIFGELYFSSNTGADFGKYISYIEFFFNNSESTNHGQGVLYYYLVSSVIDFRS